MRCWREFTNDEIATLVFKEKMYLHSLRGIRNAELRDGVFEDFFKLKGIKTIPPSTRVADAELEVLPAFNLYPPTTLHLTSPNGCNEIAISAYSMSCNDSLDLLCDLIEEGEILTQRPDEQLFTSLRMERMRESIFYENVQKIARSVPVDPRDIFGAMRYCRFLIEYQDFPFGTAARMASEAYSLPLMSEGQTTSNH